VEPYVFYLVGRVGIHPSESHAFDSIRLGLDAIIDPRPRGSTRDGPAADSAMAREDTS
jgi:hypothetical protein